MKVVYRRYASLFFIVGVEAEEEVRQLAHAAAGQMATACVFNPSQFLARV